MPVISIADAERYASTALRMVGFAQKAADSTARALVLAEFRGFPLMALLEYLSTFLILRTIALTLRPSR